MSPSEKWREMYGHPEKELPTDWNLPTKQCNIVWNGKVFVYDVRGGGVVKVAPGSRVELANTMKLALLTPRQIGEIEWFMNNTPELYSEEDRKTVVALLKLSNP